MIKPSKYTPRILAKHLVVRPHVPLYLRLLIITFVILLLLALSWGMYDAGSKATKFDDEQITDLESDPLYDSKACLEKGNKELCALLAEFARRLQMKNTSHQDLAKQVKLLGEENNHLKEELSYFQHLMSGNDDATSGISIYRFDLKEEESTGQYRYTLLLVQSEQRPKDFEGNLKFLVTLRQNETKKVVQLTSKDPSSLFSINFKYYQRIEESFQVPLDTIVESIQVQVFVKDEAEAKLTQSVKLSM